MYLGMCSRQAAASWVFIAGLECGVEGAYFNRSIGATAYSGVFAAWCDLREIVPLTFGYMMAAKVGQGLWPSWGRCGSPTRSTRSR
jgi:ABC-type transporter Mla maintaining outer membrane lipid asymmetry permease subunit MlaE